MALGGFGMSRRTVIMLRVFGVLIVVFVGLGYLVPDVHHSFKRLKIVPAISSRLCPIPAPLPSVPPSSSASAINRYRVVKGLPAKRFRDNLRNDTHYITGWSSAGFTNAVMNFANMIYLGKLSDRVPVVPPFAPAQHISKKAGIIPFSDIFDLEILRHALNMDILDWRDVKDLPSRYALDPYSHAEAELLGCWTTTKESSSMPATADNTVNHLGLDVSYTRIPSFVRMQGAEPHVVLPALAALMYPRTPLVDPGKTTVFAQSPEGHALAPDAHIACFDTLYYATSGVRAFEWERSWSPVWNMVGRNLRFTQAVEDLAHEYMMRSFALDDGEEIPPFIAVHIRRGDFHGQCKPHSHSNPAQDGPNDCFPPLSSYAHRVNEVKSQLLDTQNISVSNVIVMSDDTSPLFWSSVRSHGYFLINHTAEATLATYGEWYEPLLDTVIQSHATGFVGTRGSTFSLVGERRVLDWRGGAFREVSIREGV